MIYNKDQQRLLWRT